LVLSATSTLAHHALQVRPLNRVTHGPRDVDPLCPAAGRWVSLCIPFGPAIRELVGFASVGVGRLGESCVIHLLPGTGRFVTQ
jgi:hypothetical protein